MKMGNNRKELEVEPIQEMKTSKRDYISLALQGSILVSSIIIIILLGEINKNEFIFNEDITPLLENVTDEINLLKEETRRVQRSIPKDRSLLSEYCATSSHFRNCFTAVSEVERILALENPDAIYNFINNLEPQYGPVFLWAVDQSVEEADSHLSLDVQGTVNYFDNPAYYYSVEEHRESVFTGGWAIGFWKTLPSNGTIWEALQLTYCEVTLCPGDEQPCEIRVCGAFNIYSEGINVS